MKTLRRAAKRTDAVDVFDFLYYYDVHTVLTLIINSAFHRVIETSVVYSSTTEIVMQ